MDLEERTLGQWWYEHDARVVVPIDGLRNFAERALEEAGATAEDARFIAGVLMSKTIQGDHQRGIDNLRTMLRAAQAGEVDLRPDVQVVRETAATALVDGGPRASSYLVGRAAMDLAITKARDAGIGWVAARSPAAILTAHVLQAVERGCIGLAMTQSYPTVAPFGGRGPMLGNAPVAVGLPARDHDPFVLDLSLTQTSSSGVKLAAREKTQLPAGFILDEYGNPTRDPLEYPARGFETHSRQRARGTLTTLGDSHKGYALVLAVGLLTTLLPIADAAWEVDQIGQGLPLDGRYGAVFAAIDPDAFDPDGDVPARVDGLLDAVKASPRRDGVDEILYPGETSQRLRAERERAGVCAVPSAQLDDLIALAAEIGVPLAVEVESAQPEER
jgi:LDH2 family malate/lactate/ureidoglycolate dehydrogenase